MNEHEPHHGAEKRLNDEWKDAQAESIAIREKLVYVTERDLEPC